MSGSSVVPGFPKMQPTPSCLRISSSACFPVVCTMISHHIRDCRADPTGWRPFWLHQVGRRGSLFGMYLEIRDSPSPLCVPQPNEERKPKMKINVEDIRIHPSSANDSDDALSS